MPNKRARHLRRHSTKAEAHLWQSLRDRQLANYKFRRQHPIGRHIVDFACTEHQLIIEIDGGQHADDQRDAQRTAWLESQGWKVIRFWNNDVLANTEGVVETILQTLQAE